MYNVYDFFDDVLSAAIGELDIANHIQKITDDFDIDKLKKLLYDIEFYLFYLKDVRESKISEEEINRAIEKLQDKNEKLPIEHRPAFKDSSGKTIWEARNVLNIEKLIYPYEFMLLYQLKSKLESWISKSKSTNLKKDEKVKMYPQGFHELFHSEKKKDIAIEVLKKVQPPIIGEGNNFLLGERQKGSIVAWVKIIRSKGLIKNVPDEVLAMILNREFMDLELGRDARTLRNEQTTSYNKYYNRLLAFFS